LPQHEGRSHRQAGADHVADHHAEAVPTRLRCHQQRFRETATLVELDVDHVETAGRGGHVGKRKDAFVPGDRDQRSISGQVRVTTACQRLLQQRHTLFVQRRDQGIEIADTEALVAVYTKPGIRPGFPDRLHAADIEVEFSGELDLDRARLRIVPRTFRHLFGPIRAEREGGTKRLRRRQPGQLPDRLLAPGRFEIP